MFSNNPYSELSGFIPSAISTGYVILMVVFVVGGTLFDILHKKSARFFFKDWRNARNKGSKQVSGQQMASLAIRTFCVEVLTSAEFCTVRRRISHLLMMYGFFAYVITSAIMVVGYSNPTHQAPTFLPLLWHIGVLMICVGGYWFWFFIRVDVAAEGNSPFRIVRADLFILSLLVSVTLGLVWSIAQSASMPRLTGVAFAAYAIATTVLFGSVPWSKFAHMFFKPAAAFQKRVADADASRSRLPPPADKAEVFGSAHRLPQNY